MHKNSNNARLSAMALGERVYVETKLDAYGATMRAINAPSSRRPAILDGRVFSTKLFTAIGSSAGDVRYLVCIERVG